jgi:hypothetical protein
MLAFIALFLAFVFDCSYAANTIDLHQVSLTLENERDEAIIRRLLGKLPPAEWRFQQDCHDKNQQLECYLGKVLKSQRAASQLLNLARQHDLHLMLDQSKFQSAQKVVFDPRTYQTYVDYPTSDQESIWTPEQVQVVNDVVANLPSKLTSFKHMKNIYHIGGGYFLTRDRSLPSKRPDTVAVTQNPTFLNGVLRNEGFIALFSEPIFTFGNNQDSRDTLVHELAHALDHQSAGTDGLELSRRPEWWSLSWEKIGHQFSPIARKLFVSNYAMTSPAEDFAESVNIYLTAPERLKQASLAKFKFIEQLLR